VSILRQLVQLIIPTRCVACQRVGAEVLCTECRSGLELVGEKRCLRCGRRRETTFASPDCGECFGRRLGVTRARSLYVYNAVGRALLAEFKYRGHLGVGEVLAGQLAAWLSLGWQAVFDEVACTCDLVIPVPLHRSRVRTRRFNQSELIARVVSKALGLPCMPDALARTRETPTQVGLTEHQRRENVRGAFDVLDARRRLVDGRRVLLVDDLMTTGATLAACAGALRRAGCGVAYGLTLFSTHLAVEPPQDVSAPTARQV